jgi:tRNA/rRNA methyltransferase
VRELEPKNYFHPESRSVATMRTLRTALTKTGWSSNDVKMMHGIIGALTKPPRRTTRD